MKRATFYMMLRGRGSKAFGRPLDAKEVAGMELILDECIAQRADLGQTAYILATAYGETGGRMQPIRENMRYSAKRIAQVFSAKRLQGHAPAKLAYKPSLLANTVYGGRWGQENLGNRPGTSDGWDFRGFWIGQITGRDNALKWGKGLGVDLVGSPDLLNDLNLAVKGLVRPMLEGWATGKKLGLYVEGSRRDYTSARRVWNGMFEAAKYASYARSFESALTSAGYEPADMDPIKPAPPPVPDVVAAKAPATESFAELLRRLSMWWTRK